MQPKAKSVDDYLAGVKDGDKRAALKKLRKTIKSLVPDAEECISYGMPAFRHDGRMLVYFAAAAKHCALYGPLISAHQKELAGYDTSKGTIRFQPDKPLPIALLRKLLKTRIADNAAKAARRKKPKASKRKS
jgi:uncharacterized protein YdhG (YjbR/CyaY superfamily)